MTSSDLPAVDNVPCPPLRPLPEMMLSRFFIPRFEDKPQNPIMDTLRLMRSRPLMKNTSITSLPILPLPRELHELSQDALHVTQEKHDDLASIWELAVTQRQRHLNQVLTWDVLRPSFDSHVVDSPFLSEQESEVFASARYHLRPPFQDPETQLVYVHLPDLFHSLLLTVSGTSSALYIWDPVSQSFTLRDLAGKRRGKIVVVGKDEVLSASLLKRFLTIGNLMRRLESLTDSRETTRSTPVTHAFTHALSSILGYLRHTAEDISLNARITMVTDARLTAFWAQYEDIESILRAVATLCGRDENIAPSDHVPLPTTPTDLLSLIYKHLTDHLEQSSLRIVSAMLAFVLTTTSRGYIQSLCDSVGYNTPASRSRASINKHLDHTDRLGTGLLEDTNDQGDLRPDDEQGDGAKEFPDFITPEVAEVLSRARKSLVLLRAAHPEHPLLTSNHMHPEIEWVWTEEQLDNLEDELSHGVLPKRPRIMRFVADEEESSTIPMSATDVMSEFGVFNLVPGEAPTTTTLGSNAANLLSNANAISSLRNFVAAFPPSLPSSTPTLTHLTACVLAPLIAHAQALSEALVTHFLKPTTRFHLHSHLVLLRGYILLTTHAFKACLQDALFADTDDVSAPVVGSRTYAAREAREQEREQARSKSGRSRSRPPETETTQTKRARRAIGLSPALTIGDKWPPLGSDLNFLLRTVVVDALEQGREVDEIDDESMGTGMVDEVRSAQRQIVEEAGWRLGFAIRDLPSGTGREKWLNPLSIEALDFLYMHYQPPHPLDVLITPAVLSKYHRMFAFNLRLMRVENVVRALFRLTRKATAPLFPTLTSSNKLLLHFRFVVHAFVMAFSSYVYDIAIGSNIDAFLARLAGSSAAERGVGFEHQGVQESPAFPDVFSLAEYHSRVLDDVLSSCLLRSGQKAVGDILRACMELVLELGVLAGELKDGNLEEYEAAPMLEDLWARFRAKMTTFVKVLKALVEKEADSTGLVLSDIPLHMMHGHRRVSGTTANLHQLLLRLNMSDWWTRKDRL